MISIGFISLDIIILLLIFAILFFISFKTGKRKIVSLILAVYPSLLIFEYFPYVSFESGKPEAFSFIIIYLVIFMFIRKHLANRKMNTPIRKLVDYRLLAISYMMLIISVSSNQISSLQNLYTFTGVIPLLINNIDFGLLLILPIVLIFLTSKSDKI